MTRARILADYVAGGTTATEFDYLDGLTSTAVGINDTQTLANKTLASTTSFPSGHVIQVVSDMQAFDGSGSLVADGATYTDDTHANGVLISNVTAGNKLISMVSGGYAYYHTTSATYVHFRTGFSPDTGDDTFYDAESYYTRTLSDFAFQVVPSIQSLYTIPSGVTSVAVIRRVVSDHANAEIGWNSSNSKYVHCIIMEVQG